MVPHFRRDHIINIVGEDHATLGIDYVFDRQELDDYLAKMTATFPEEFRYAAGYEDAAAGDLPAVVRELATLGHRMPAGARRQPRFIATRRFSETAGDPYW